MMIARTPHPADVNAHAMPLISAAHEGAPVSGTLEVFPHDRVGAPIGRSRRRSWLKSSLILALLGGSGWALLRDDGSLLWWVVAEYAALTDRVAEPRPAQLVAATAPPPVAGPAPPAVAPPAVAAVPPPAPIDTQQATVADVRPTTGEATEASAAEPAPAPLPEPVAEDAPPPPLPKLPPSTDPLERKAESVGLNPGLSRALLQRLSATDYRNARMAIAKALASTPDDEILVVPPERMPRLAQFRVHFVRGAAADCRRYIVTVAKDGWSTTALPMETCGIKPVPSRRH